MADVPTTDRLVGIRDLAELLGRPQRTLGEWRGKQRILPDSELTVDKRGTLIWRLSHVLEVLAFFGVYDGARPAPMLLPDLVSYDYIEQATGAGRRAIHDWRRTLVKHGKVVRAQRLPDPAHTISGVPLWERSTIDAWVAEHHTEKVTA